MENSNRLDPASAPGDAHAGGLSAWQKTRAWLWNAWRTATRGRPERRYARRVLGKLKNGELHATLGIEVRDAEYTKAKAERWLGHLKTLGLRPEHLCVEYGCGSLWAAEPVIHYLQPGRFVGLDVTSEFYDLGRQRLGGLIGDKQVRLAVIGRKSLRETATLKPDFVYSRKVLPHVARRALPRYVRSIASLAAEHTIILIDNTPVRAPDGSFQGRRHTVDALRPYLPPHVAIRQLDFGIALHHASRTLPGL